jgi:hypothetical protein
MLGAIADQRSGMGRVTQVLDVLADRYGGGVVSIAE